MFNPFKKSPFSKVVDLQMAHIAEMERRGPDLPEDVISAAKSILETNSELFLSVELLMKKKYYFAALSVTRSIVENCITLAYIFDKDTEARASKYISFASDSLLKRMKKKKVKDQDLVNAIRQIEELHSRNKLPKSGPDKRYWDGKNFREMCSELKLDTIYEEGYQRLSAFVHSQYKKTGHVDLESGSPYNAFLKRYVKKDIFLFTAMALEKVNLKYNILEGYMVLEDYPEGTTLFFDFSKNKG